MTVDELFVTALWWGKELVPEYKSTVTLSTLTELKKKIFLSTYYVPGIVLDTWGASVKWVKTKPKKLRSCKVYPSKLKLTQFPIVLGIENKINIELARK